MSEQTERTPSQQFGPLRDEAFLRQVEAANLPQLDEIVALQWARVQDQLNLPTDDIAQIDPHTVWALAVSLTRMQLLNSQARPFDAQAFVPEDHGQFLGDGRLDDLVGWSLRQRDLFTDTGRGASDPAMAKKYEDIAIRLNTDDTREKLHLPHKPVKIS